LRRGWHLVAIDVLRLLPTAERKIGLLLVSVAVVG
jgi:hypothetical protein